mgnify:CR=1 FL=1
MADSQYEEVFQAIAKDCFDNNKVRKNQNPREFEFTPEQNEEYKKIVDGNFWGGYAYLDEDLLFGFIRLYSPMGSAKFVFEKAADGTVKIEVC